MTGRTMPRSEFLRELPTARIRSMLSTARTRFYYADNSEIRLRAMTEINACKAELKARGVEIPP